jgi:hypothetical protein
LPVLQYADLEVLRKAQQVNNELKLLRATAKGRFGLELSPHRAAPSAVSTAAATLRTGKNTEYIGLVKIMLTLKLYKTFIHKKCMICAK